MTTDGPGRIAYDRASDRVMGMVPSRTVPTAGVRTPRRPDERQRARIGGLLTARGDRLVSQNARRLDSLPFAPQRRNRVRAVPWSEGGGELQRSADCGADRRSGGLFVDGGELRVVPGSKVTRLTACHVRWPTRSHHGAEDGVINVGNHGRMRTRASEPAAFDADGGQRDAQRGSCDFTESERLLLGHLAHPAAELLCRVALVERERRVRGGHLVSRNEETEGLMFAISVSCPGDAREVADDRQKAGFADS